MPLKRTHLKTALSITGDFETAGNPWAAITGDFDQMGISCGVLQWNIGQGSLQPLVKSVGKAAVLKYMPKHGEDFWDACNNTIEFALIVVRSWQTQGVIKPEYKTEFEKLFGSPEMIEKQIDKASEVGEQAYQLAKKWAKEERAASEPTVREIVWFFDLVTQNGGTKGLWLSDVKSFLAQHGKTKSDDFICDWLKALPSSAFGRKDAARNADLWRNNIKPEYLNLFVLGYLRCLKSRSEYQGVVMNRRGTIAVTKGWVNGEQEDLSVLR